MATKTAKKTESEVKTVVASKNGDHPLRKEFPSAAKKDGVRIARASRGGYKVVVQGTNHRVLSGLWETPAQAERAAKLAKLNIVGTPREK